MIGRREFIAGLGSAAAWPLVAWAQQPERVRRIGVLLPAAADDAEYQARLGAFHQGLALSGWSIGRNVRIDIRWATANAAEIRKHAAELVALAPDVIVANGGATAAPLMQMTRTVPIVFPVVVDPVGAGFVESLARPAGNATGFMDGEYSMGAKWLELLKQIAPNVTRDERALLNLLNRWRAEAEKQGHRITRIAVALRSFGMVPKAAEPPSSASSRPWRRRSRWRSTRRTCATLARLSAPSRLSAALRMEVWS